MSVLKAVRDVRKIVKDHGGRCVHTDAVQGKGAPLPSAVLAGIVAKEEGPERAGELLANLRRRLVIPGVFEAACISMLTQHAQNCEGD